MKWLQLLAFLALLQSPAMAAVTGVVIDPNGTAMPEVKVTAYAPESSSDRRARLLAAKERIQLGAAITNDKGRFSVEVKDAPVFDLTFSRPGHAPSTLRVTPDDTLGAIMLRPAEERSGSIRSNQKPVQDALVVITARDGSEMMLRTDENGRYRAPDPEVWAETMTVLHDDSARLDVQRQFRSKFPMDASLTRGTKHSGTVVARDGKTVVAGARIFVDGWPAGVSGDDGTFALDRLPAKWKELRAVSGGLSGSQLRRNSSSPVIRMMPASRLSGRVTEVGGDPIAGAMVLLSSGPDENFDEDGNGEWAITDADGTFTFPPMMSGTHTILARMPGYVETTSKVSIPESTRVTRKLTLARAGSLDGFVVDENDKPVAGARIATGAAWESRPFGDREGFAGPDGRFVIRSVPPTGYDLKVSRKGYARFEKMGPRVASGERRSNFRIVLPAGFELTGRVTDTRGRPVAGATINTIKSTPGMTDAWMLSFFAAEDVLPTTGNDGAFSFRLTEGTYDIEVRREGFASHRSGNVAVSRRNEPLKIVLESGERISGRILRESGAPVADAELFVLSDQHGPGGPASSAGDGTFILEDLHPGKMTLYVSKPEDFISLTRSVTAPDADVLITLPASGVISGRVIDKTSKNPITSFSAGVRSGSEFAEPMMKEFRSDDGTFLLENVPEGTQEIEVAAAGYVTVRLAGVAVDMERSGEPLEVAMEPGVRVIGKVTGPDGSGLGNVIIHLGDSNIEFAPPLVDFTTDPGGEYILENIAAGEQPLLFRKSGYVPERKIVTISGKEMRVDVTLSSGLELNGSVVDSSGMPVAGASVSAWSSGDVGNGSSTSGADGTFKIEGLTPGRYAIRASKTGLTPADLPDVDIATAGPLKLVLSPGGTIHGRVTGYDESQRARIVVRTDGGDTASIDAAGNFRIEGVSPGQVRVSASSGSITIWKRVELQEGQSVQVDLEFRNDIVISGRVSSNGEPVGLARVTFVPRDLQVRSFAFETTDGDGFYSVAGLERGEYNVEVVDRNRAAAYGTTYSVRSSDRFDIEIKGATLRGRVIDADSREGLANAGVVLTSTSDSGNLKPTSLPSGLTGWDGNFELQNIPAGRFELRVQKDGWGHQVREITVGAESAQNLIFELTKAVGITLRVRDARDGRSLVPVVLAMDAAHRLAYQGSGAPSADGSVTVSLGEGPYRMTVDAPGYAARTISAVAPGEASVALTPGGTLQVTLSGSERAVASLLFPSGEPYFRSAWSSSPELILNPGVNVLANILPGNYTLVILDASGQPGKSESVTVTEGQTTRVTL